MVKNSNPDSTLASRQETTPALAAAVRAVGSAVALSLLLAVSATAVQAQAPADNPPKAVLSEVIHDFGEVVRADIAEKIFEIRNEGGSPLLLREVQTTCACTVVDFPRSIAPGESGEIKVELDTDFVDGGFQAQAFIYTNDPAMPKIDLTLKVETRPYVFAYPGYVRYNIHRFYPTDDPEAGFVRQLIWADRPTDFKILSVESPIDYLEVEFSEVPAENRNPKHEGVQWMIVTRIPPDAPVGPLAGYLRVEVEHEKQSKLSIPISGFVRPLFAVTPAAAELGDLELAKEPLRTSVHVKHFDVKPRFEVTSAESDVPGLAFEVESIDEGREYWVHITVPLEMAKGPFSGTLDIHTTSEEQPILSVPISGRIL